jgi:hypothetical protein
MFYYQLKQAVCKGERLILENLGFNTCVELPHKFLLNYLNVLQLSKNTLLAQTSWNYMNDSMRTLACVRYRPEVIASAAIFMAAEKLGIAMHEEPTPWWTLFDANLDEMEHVCWMLTRLYENPTPKLIHVLKNEEPRHTRLDEFVAAMTNSTDTQPTNPPHSTVSSNSQRPSQAYSSRSSSNGVRNSDYQNRPENRRR